MDNLRTQLAHRAKAIAGAVIGAAVSYAGTAVITGTVFTWHGLEAAAVAAAMTGLGVHTVPNRPKKA